MDVRGTDASGNEDADSLPPSSSLDRYKQSHTHGGLPCREHHHVNLFLAEQRAAAERPKHYIPRPKNIETVFRHSGWQGDRRRAGEALSVAGVPAARRQRFDACGASCCVEWHPEERRYRTVGFYCGDRLCKPCGRARAARGRRAITTLVGTDPARLITLSRRSKEESLTDALNHLYRSFQRLRRSRVWSESVTGGVAVCEIKRGRNSGQWHVHLHCLCVGSYVSQRELSDAWLRATGDSFVVDVRAIREQEKGISYVCKYLGKGFDSSLYASVDDLAECCSALHGRRLLVAFGDWYGRVGDVDGDDRGGWQLVGGLAQLFADAAAGDPHAGRVIFSLHNQVKNGRAEESPPVCDDS